MKQPNKVNQVINQPKKVYKKCEKGEPAEIVKQATKPG